MTAEHDHETESPGIKDTGEVGSLNDMDDLQAIGAQTIDLRSKVNLPYGGEVAVLSGTRNINGLNPSSQAETRSKGESMVSPLTLELSDARSRGNHSRELASRQKGKRTAVQNLRYNDDIKDLGPLGQ